MQRIAVVGSGGAGKSTFSTVLGDQLGLPVVHLDEHFWRPGWVETPRDEWRAVQERLFNSDAWIADGNYGGTLDIRLSRADTVIILALPRLSCVLGALRRTMSNRGVAVQAPGCPERLDREFIMWIWRYSEKSRPRLDASLSEHGSHLRVIELSSRRSARRFVEDVQRRSGE